MASDYIPTNVTSGFDMETTINNNFNAIKTAMDKLLNRELSSDNAMEIDSDLNGFNILNLPAPGTPTSPVRLVDINGSVPTLQITSFNSLDVAKAAIEGNLGDFITVAEATSGTSQGGGVYKIVASGTGTADGKYFVDKTVGDLDQLQLIIDKGDFSNILGYGALKATPLSALVEGDLIHVAFRTTSGDSGGGVFVWNTSNLSSKVTSDTAEGVYVAPSFDATGASGAFVRQFEGNDVFASWFGILLDGSDESSTAQAVQDFSTSEEVERWIIGAGELNLGTTGLLVSNSNSRAAVPWGSGPALTELSYDGSGTAVEVFGAAGNTKWKTLGNFRIVHTSTGNRNGVGLEFRGTTYWHAINTHIRYFETGVLLHNKNAGEFTEFAVMTHYDMLDNTVGVELKVTAGNSSFHGCSFVQGATHSGTGETGFKIGLGSFWYNFTIDNQHFTKGGQLSTYIDNSGNCINGSGSLTFENDVTVLNINTARFHFDGRLEGSAPSPVVFSDGATGTPPPTLGFKCVNFAQQDGTMLDSDLSPLKSQRLKLEGSTNLQAIFQMTSSDTTAIAVVGDKQNDIDSGLIVGRSDQGDNTVDFEPRIQMTGNGQLRLYSPIGASATSGTVVNVLRVYDAAGGVLGYIPIHTNFTP